MSSLIKEIQMLKQDKNSNTDIKTTVRDSPDDINHMPGNPSISVSSDISLPTDAGLSTAVPNNIPCVNLVEETLPSQATMNDGGWQIVKKKGKLRSADELNKTKKEPA